MMLPSKPTATNWAVHHHDSMRHIYRDGESTRLHLISCSERYLRKRTVDGYTGSSAEELAGEQKEALEYSDVKLNGNPNTYNIVVSPLSSSPL